MHWVEMGANHEQTQSQIASIFRSALKLSAPLAPLIRRHSHDGLTHGALLHSLKTAKSNKQQINDSRLKQSLSSDLKSVKTSLNKPLTNKSTIKIIPFPFTSERIQTSKINEL